MDFNNFDFPNSAIIKPPTQAEREQHNNDSLVEQKLIMIDSRDRNINLYPNNNDFIIELDEPINDVSELELVSANMPINSYNINEHNNRLYFFINTIDNITQFPKAYDHVDNAGLYNSDGTIKKDQIYYIKILPNNYQKPETLINYLKLNNHYVYKLSTNTIVDLASLFIQYNSDAFKYNIAIFTVTPPQNTLDIVNSEYVCPKAVNMTINTANAIKNSIIFRGDKTLYNNKIMYNYLPNSVHEIFGFDINYGFIDYTYNIIRNNNVDYNLNHYDSSIIAAADATDISNLYNSPTSIYTKSGNTVEKNINGFTAVLDISQTNDIFTNISNTMATTKVNDYVLLHLPSLPTMANKIASNNIVQNAYTKLHIGTGSTRNVFFGRIKAFTNVYTLKPSVKLCKLHIKLTDYNGNLFDFNNFNFTLTFSIMYNKQPKFYNY